MSVPGTRGAAPRPTPDEAPSTSPVPAARRDDWCVVDGLLTHAIVRGAGPPLVLVPGIGCSAFVYDRLADALAPHFTVWSYDPPAHGRSANAPLRALAIDRLSTHLAAWMRARGLGGATLLGHSLGGEVTLALAARFPDLLTHLVLLAPTGVPDNPSVTLQLLRLAADAPLERPGLLARVWASYVRIGLRRVWRIAADQRHHLLMPLLPLVQARVLLVQGSRDPVLSSGDLKALCAPIPHTREHTVEGAHAFWYGRPHEVARLVLDFTSERAPRHD